MDRLTVKATIHRGAAYRAFLALICALGLTAAQADPEKEIGVELQLGESYAVALGAEASARAKQVVELALARVLADKIRYFSFTPLSDTDTDNTDTDTDTRDTHTLTFRIDHPGADLARDGQAASLNDYYVFVEFRKAGASDFKSILWLFRDAASNLNGVDSPESIADKLGRDLRRRYHSSVIRELLTDVSFTENARFISHRAKGWIIDHSRQSLCMPHDTEIQVRSIVPVDMYEESYSARVKRRPQGDDQSTFTKATVPVDELLDEPASARVVAVYVIDYEAECENPLVESSPETVSFQDGGGQ